MPYVRGETLRERLRREGQLPVGLAVDLTRQVASALDHAHREGVVHRDLKPENILLADGRARVADFGVAKALAEGGDSRLTETGLALGTPAYMAPEQATGGRVDAQGIVHKKCVADPTSPCPTCIETNGVSQCDINLQGWIFGSCDPNQPFPTACSTNRANCMR